MTAAADPTADPTSATETRANLTKGEPALLVSGVGAVVSYLGAALVSHGVLGSAQMSAAEQTIVPAVSAAVVVLLGLITRRLVKPARWLERELARLEGTPSRGAATSPLSDEDWSRITGILRAELSTVAGNAGAKPNPGRTTS